MFLTLILPQKPAYAQALPLDSVVAGDTTRHAIRLRDGSLLVGHIAAITADSVRVELQGGTSLTVARTSIDTVERFSAERMRNGEYWFENPHATRLLFSATAFPLKAGTGYYANSWLLFHTFASGLTDRISIGGGFSYIPGIAFTDNVFFLLPKVTLIDAPGAKLAVGALLGFLPFDNADDDGDESSSAGILYGVGSFGTQDSQISVGLGWGYAGGDVGDRPVVMVGIQNRLARRVAFISENWFFPISGESEGVVSAGLRFLGEGVSVDFALLRPTEGDFVLPWLGFAFRFR